ncbi:MAG TPA: RICIN domain-containing protein [Candidatus Saccharimonadales bacterium]|nr:RICIN domain-containing protein [Candidatus Saccharimonadales bacterium]
MPAKKSSNRAKASSARTKRAPVRGSIISQRFKFLASSFTAVVVLLSGIYLATSNAATKPAGTVDLQLKNIANKCLDNQGSRKKNGNKIQLWHCNRTSAQHWAVGGDGTLRIANDTKYCLDTKDSGTAEQTPLVLWQCDTSHQSQKWQFMDDGSVKNTQSGLCLDDKYSGNKNGNTIWLWHCNQTNAQIWKAVSYRPVTGGDTGSTNPSSGGGSGNTGGSTGNTGGGSGTGSNGSIACQVSGSAFAVPAAYVKPTASNTGVPAGTTLTTTAPDGVSISGNVWNVTKNGTTIEGKEINGRVSVAKGLTGITIKNSRIHAPDGVDGAVAQGGNDNAPNVTIMNTEIYTSKGGYNGVLLTNNSKVCGSNIHGFENNAVLEGNGIVFQGNYIHVNQASPGKKDPHDDGVEVRVGNGIKILGNNIVQTNADESWQHNTSALYVAATWGDLDNVQVDGNWFGGGTFSLYNVTVKVNNPPAQLKNVDVTNNKWYRGSYAYGPYATDDNSNWKARTWSNNSYEDNGAAIAR